MHAIALYPENYSCLLTAEVEVCYSEEALRSSTASFDLARWRSIWCPSSFLILKHELHAFHDISVDTWNIGREYGFAECLEMSFQGLLR